MLLIGGCDLLHASQLRTFSISMCPVQFLCLSCRHFRSLGLFLYLVDALYQDILWEHPVFFSNGGSSLLLYIVALSYCENISS